jgi:hypothetical protein
MNGHRLFPVLAVGFALAALPVQLLAQGCNTCTDICGANAHLDECGSAFYGFSGGCFPNYCHNGSCASAHYFNCSWFADLTVTEIDQVVRAAQGENTDQLRAFILSSDQAFLHVERNAVQIIGCGGEVIASITLSAEAFDKLRDLAPVIAMRQPRAAYRELSAIAAVLPR